MKRKSIFLTLIILTSILLNVSILSAQEKNKFDSELFSITGPKGWKMEADRNSWMPVKYINNINNSAVFKETINVSFANPEESKDEFINGLKKQVDNFIVIKQGNKKVKNKNTEWIVYTYTYKNFKIKGKVYFFGNKDKPGLLVGYTSNISSYGRFLEEFEKTVDSTVLY
ncbi:MAG: hypothetical protein U9R42_07015 [Bacteroidota bacterium]|nr:hypothetical protein [Bacteroidota bacterium]